MSNKKIDLHICIVTSWFPSKKNPDFPPFVYDFAKNLANFGVNVSIILPLYEGEQLISKEDSFTIYRVKGKFPLFSILRLINQIRPQIIHVHAPEFFSSPAVLAARIKNIPIIATIHRAEVVEVGKKMHLLRKLVLRRFKKIIAVSEFTKALTIKAGANENKICVIYNSCNETSFSYRNKFEMRKKHEIPNDKKVILFVGQLIKRKNVSILIESLRILFTKFPNFLVLISGRGEEGKKLELLVNEYGLDTNVKFLGRLTNNELPDYYYSADVFVLPSLHEGHSVAILEAMISGLPIIASNIPANRVSVSEGVNGFLFETNNEKDLAEKLRSILTDNKLQEQMSKNSTNIYFKNFSTKAQIENHLKLYRTLIEAK